jgi:hypothetical protein
MKASSWEESLLGRELITKESTSQAVCLPILRRVEVSSH